MSVFLRLLKSFAVLATVAVVTYAAVVLFLRFRSGDALFDSSVSVFDGDDVSLEDSVSVVVDNSPGGASVAGNTTNNVTNVTQEGDSPGSGATVSVTAVPSFLLRFVDLTDLTLSSSGKIGDIVFSEGVFIVADSVITTRKIADGSVTNDKLADGTIDGSKIINNTITGNQLSTELTVENIDVGGDLLVSGDFSLEDFSKGSVLFVSDDGLVAQDHDNFFWDSGDERLGLGTDNPTAVLDLASSSSANASLRLRSGVAPSSPHEGDVYADGTDIFYYDGSSWVDLTQTGGGSDTLSTLGTTNGDILVLQWFRLGCLDTWN